MTMQPSLILPIILKDLRANRWLFVAYYAATIIYYFLFPEKPNDENFITSLIENLLALGNILLWLLLMARVVQADLPNSNTAFLVTRPVSGTTLFFAKFSLICVVIVLLPEVIAAAFQILLRGEGATDLNFGISLLKNTLIALVIFALCIITKKLRWFFVWLVPVCFGFVLCYLGSLFVYYILIKFFYFFNNTTWEKLAALHFLNVNLIAILPFIGIGLGIMAFFGITWWQYVRPSTLRTAILGITTLCVIGIGSNYEIIKEAREINKLWFKK